MKKELDAHGVMRFKGNRIVRYVLDTDSNLNEIWILAQQGKFTRQEMREFYKLIGTSVGGYYDIDFTVISK